jgi:hypothetical protein
MPPVLVYAPRCVQNALESLGLKALEDFDVGIGGKMINTIFQLHLYIQ